MDHDDKKYKAELLDLYCRIADTLRENGIRFWGVYGTCLGAVREHGIIPWDDDIDLAVWRSDLDLVLRVLSNSGRGIVAADSRKLSCAPECYGRAYNRIDDNSPKERVRAYIDIYAIDRADDSKVLFLLRSLFLVGLDRIVKRRLGLLTNAHPIGYLGADLFAFPFRCLPSSVLSHWVRTIYLASRGKRFVKLPFDGRKRRYPIGIFEKQMLIPFGHVQIPVPVEYDLYLSMIYGNWRQPPPESQRQSHAFDYETGAWNVQLPAIHERLSVS